MGGKLPTLFIVCAAAAVGIFFFLVIKPFILPLIFALVLAVLFWPWHEVINRACRGHNRVAAAITTAVVLLVVLVPVGGGVMLAGVQLVKAAENIDEELDLVKQIEGVVNSNGNSARGAWFRNFRSRFTEEEFERAKQMASSAVAGVAKNVYERTMSLVANVVAFVIGLAVLTLGLYYFFADKDKLLAEVSRLSPLDEQEDRELADNFVSVCRGVLLGNVLAAVVQAILNGIGFAFAGVPNVWLLAIVTFFLSMIPFVGAGAVWGAVAIGLAIDGQLMAASLLALYGFLIVSTSDNLIRAYAIHDRAHIHPLVALISILGAIQLIGLWGIIIGPVTAALFYVLLNIMDKKVKSSDDIPSQERVRSVPQEVASDV